MVGLPRGSVGLPRGNDDGMEVSAGAYGHLVWFTGTNPAFPVVKCSEWVIIANASSREAFKCERPTSLLRARPFLPSCVEGYDVRSDMEEARKHSYAWLHESHTMLMTRLCRNARAFSNRVNTAGYLRCRATASSDHVTPHSAVVSQPTAVSQEGSPATDSVPTETSEARFHVSLTYRQPRRWEPLDDFEENVEMSFKSSAGCLN